MFESVNRRMDGRTHGWTPARLVYYKLTMNFSSITLLIMPRLSKHKQFGTIGMLQARVRVSDIA